MNYIRELSIKDIVLNALREDIGKKDITTWALVPENKSVKAVLLAKQDCVICGLGVACVVFKAKGRGIKFKSLVKEGDFVKKGKIIARITGKARSILSAERVALNFLAHLCGIATQTRKFKDAIKPYKAKIMDTRKTTPGLRILEKYAVRIGGGFNHRMRLDEMVLVKDNHLKITKGYKGLKGLEMVSRGYRVELEAKNLKEFKEALKLHPDVIMLDNMNIADMKRAVELKRGTRYLPVRQAGAIRDTLLEASGGITLKNVKKIASCGIEMISVGTLTHSVQSVDLSLEII
jgi:nicotinate-nucleotide pyrophosphorylase (carboxylating)